MKPTIELVKCTLCNRSSSLLCGMCHNKGWFFVVTAPRKYNVGMFIQSNEEEEKD